MCCFLWQLIYHMIPHAHSLNAPWHSQINWPDWLFVCLEYLPALLALFSLWIPHYNESVSQWQMQVGPLCTKQFTHSHLAINSVCAMCWYWHNRMTVLASVHTQLGLWRLMRSPRSIVGSFALCMCVRTLWCTCGYVSVHVWARVAHWCSMIMGLVFGEITAVVFPANKVPRGAELPGAIFNKWSGLLKVDSDIFFFLFHLT